MLLFWQLAQLSLWLTFLLFWQLAKFSLWLLAQLSIFLIFCFLLCRHFNFFFNKDHLESEVGRKVGWKGGHLGHYKKVRPKVLLGHRLIKPERAEVW